MSLDKSRIPKRGNSSRKFIPRKQRKTMTDPFVETTPELERAVHIERESLREEINRKRQEVGRSENA